MYSYFFKWLEERKAHLEDDMGIKIDKVNIAEMTANPSITVDYSSHHCLGRVSVWQSGLMDEEILHIETEERLLFKHLELNQNPDFDVILEKFFELMVSGVNTL